MKCLGLYNVSSVERHFGCPCAKIVAKSASIIASRPTNKCIALILSTHSLVGRCGACVALGA
jgi:hypothetical protein